MRKQDLSHEIFLLANNPFFKRFQKKKNISVEEALIYLIVVHEISCSFFGKAPAYQQLVLPESVKTGFLKPEDALEAKLSVQKMFSSDGKIHYTMLQDFAKPLLQNYPTNTLPADSFLLYHCFEDKRFAPLKNVSEASRKTLGKMFNDTEKGAVACAVIEAVTPSVIKTGQSVSNKTISGNVKVFSREPEYVSAHRVSSPKSRPGFDVFEKVFSPFSRKDKIELLKEHSGPLVNSLNQLLTTGNKLL